MRSTPLLLAVALASLTLTAAAQTQISGYVTDADGRGLEGVNVYEPLTYEGAVTDSAGHYRFTASAKTPFALHTQYIGYRVDSVVVEAPGREVRFRLRKTAAALADVVVTAGSFVASDTRETAVLSSVDVATTGATADLAEALSTLPGSTPAGESGQLLVRGGTAAETQAYINGLRVPNLYSARLPDVPSRTRFSPFAFRGITFATGGFSAAYGDALSGALILQTNGLPEKSLTSVNVMTLGGSVGRTQKIGARQAVAFDLGGTHLGLYAQLNEESRRTLTTAPQGLQANAGYWWEGRGGRNLKVMSQASTQRFAGANPAEARFYGDTARSLDNLNSYTQAVFQAPAGENGVAELGAALATNHDRFQGDGAAVELDQTDVQLRGTYADQYRELARWNVGAEVQGRRETVGQEIPKLTQLAKVDRVYAAGFAEADWYLSNKWVLRTGLRLDSYDGDQHSVSPRLQLSHLITPTHQIALSAGRYRQRQTDDAVFARALDLAPARVDHLGLTYSKSWKGGILRAEAYAKTYDRLLTTPTANQQLNNSETQQLKTEGSGYARGFDLFFRDRTTVRNADFWVSYSFTDAERLRGTLTRRAPVPFASRHNLAVVAKRFFAEAGFGVSATYRFHAGRPYDDPNASARYAATTPHFHDLSLNVTYLTNIRGHFTVLFASLTNVTGARQVHQYRYSPTSETETGRFDRLEVDPLFPRFPFVGMFVSIGDKGRVGTVDDI